MRRRVRRWIAVLLATPLWAGAADAQVPGTAEVILARAPADVLVRGQAAPRPVARGERLAAGDRVRTGRGGAVELRLADGSLVRLGELSDFEVEQLDVDAAGVPSASRFALLAGQARAWVARRLVARVAAGPGAFAMETPTAVAAVRQTDFAVAQDPDAVTRVYTFEGLVETTSRVGGSVLCPRNRWTRVVPGRPPEPCGVIPLRDRRSLLRVLAVESVSVGPPDPARAALDALRAKVSGEKTTGGRATGGFGTLAPGVPSGTGRPAPPPTGRVDVIVDVD